MTSPQPRVACYRPMGRHGVAALRAAKPSWRGKDGRKSFVKRAREMLGRRSECLRRSIGGRTSVSYFDSPDVFWQCYSDVEQESVILSCFESIAKVLCHARRLLQTHEIRSAEMSVVGYMVLMTLTYTPAELSPHLPRFLHGDTNDTPNRLSSGALQ